MTIDEAIEILETEAHLAKRQPETGIYAALRLGIEALTGIQKCRQYPECPFTELLPGETKE